MADNYLQFSLSFPLKTIAEKAWCTKTMTAFADLLANDFEHETDEQTEARAKLAARLGDLGQRVFDEQWDTCDFEWSIETVDPKNAEGVAEMWLHADDYGSPDQVAAFLQAYLQKFDPQGTLWFSWANTCSKMRVNEFGGGAAVVKATGTEFLDAQSWAVKLAAPSARGTGVGP